MKISSLIPVGVVALGFPSLGGRAAQAPYRGPDTFATTQIYRLDFLMALTASQIESTAQLIDEGRLLSLGIDPAALRRVYPLVIVFEQPITPLSYRAVVRKDLLDHPLLTRIESRQTAPVQLMHIHDLELAEIAVERGYNLLELLREKTAHAEASEMSFEHFMFLRGSDVWNAHSEWHGKRWKEIMAEAATYYQTLGLSPTESDDVMDSDN